MAESEVRKPIKRKPVNLSVREDLIADAKELKINVSQVAEQALADSVKAARAAAWLKENADAIEQYNERVARDGMFNEGLRRF